MKCSSCGSENPPGARYCAQCGAEQSIPTPIAAVAAAGMAPRPRNAAIPQAANAAQADPPPADLAREASGIERRAGAPLRWQRDVDRALASSGNAGPDTATPTPPPATMAGERGPPQTPPPDPPAYASAPRRAGLAAALVAACFVLALLAWSASRMFRGESTTAADATQSDAGESVMSAFPPEATPQRSRRDAATGPSPGAATPDAGAGASDAAHATSTPSTPTGERTAPEGTPGAAPPPVEIKPLPPRPAHRSARPTPAAKAPVPPEASAPPRAPAIAPPPAKAPAVAVGPSAAPVDRWAKMNDELSRCTRSDFIARVVCDQRVRFRYCAGYWGKVAQCPGNPAPERGQ